MTTLSKRPDPQDKSGSATGPMIPRGPCSREAGKVLRRETIWANIRLK